MTEYIVIAAAQCDGGYQVEEILPDEHGDAVARRYGGTIAGWFDTADEARAYAREKNQEASQ